MFAQRFAAAVAVSSLVALALVAGCSSGDAPSSAPASGISDAARPTRDASATDAAAQDSTTPDARVSPEASGSEDGCVPGVRALDQVDLDASSTADGGLNRECIRCVTTPCSAEFDRCMSDCVCNAIAGDLVRCVEQTGRLLACGEAALSSSNPVVRDVVQCASLQDQCLGVCGL